MNEGATVENVWTIVSNSKKSSGKTLAKFYKRKPAIEYFNKRLQEGKSVELYHESITTDRKCVGKSTSFDAVDDN